MSRRMRFALLALAAVIALPARADTVRANATTLFLTRRDVYAGELQRATPVFELVSITATDLSAAFAEEVEIALSTWGALDVADEVRRWQNGAAVGTTRASGDVDVGYIKGELLGRHVVLRLGRILVAEGNARMAHLDGGETRLRLPFGFGLSGYAGSPVQSRFGARGGEEMVGNERGNFATGARASWFYPGALEVGTSIAYTRDRGDVARKDVGADVRLFLPANVELVGAGFYSVPESRVGEVDVAASWRASREVQLTADFRHTEPDLFLPRTSILSVFAADKRDDVGAAIRLEPVRALTIDADYHTLFERDDNGHRARAKATWHPRASTDLGGEAQMLYHPDSAGYYLARVFAAWRQRLLELTADVQPVWLTRTVNDQRFDLTATATAGYKFARGWKILVAGTGGTSPFLVSHFDFLAKLVYDQTYVTREVP